MKILLVNKFLYPNGGSETYIFSIGKCMEEMGHSVQYFGMQDERNVVGNQVNSYTSNMDFHASGMTRLLYPFKIIYSHEARKAIRKVIENSQPDVVHLNNFNFQLTPSIIYEIKKKNIPIVYTAHDYQLVCPNHLMRNGKTNQNCNQCQGASYKECTKNRCIHGSFVKSVLGSIEAWIYDKMRTYQRIDGIICPSLFIKGKLLQNRNLTGKMIAIPNFIYGEMDEQIFEKRLVEHDFVFFFGRYSEEKGIKTLLEAARHLSGIQFVFAGKGPLDDLVCGDNIKNVGFVDTTMIKELIREAEFSIYPSEWYENCPFSVMESISEGTPVLGARIGGIPELIEEGVTGKLFESGNIDDLIQKIEQIWENRDELKRNCKNNRGRDRFDTLEIYCKKLLKFYEECRG